MGRGAGGVTRSVAVGMGDLILSARPRIATAWVESYLRHRVTVRESYQLDLLVQLALGRPPDSDRWQARGHQGILSGLTHKPSGGTGTVQRRPLPKSGFPVCLETASEKARKRSRYAAESCLDSGIARADR